jgi:hypothetical protein
MFVHAATVSRDRPRVGRVLSSMIPRTLRVTLARWLGGWGRATLDAVHADDWPEPLDWGHGLSVVIVDETGSRALAECLDAAEAALATFDEPAEIIVVACGLPDDVHARLEQAHPGVNWRFHRKPRGRARALLDGVASARHGAVYLLDAGSLPDVDAFVQAARWRASGTAVIASTIDAGATSPPHAAATPTGEVRTDVVVDAVAVPPTAVLVHAARLRGWLAGSLAHEAGGEGPIDLAGFGRRAGYDVVACAASRVHVATGIQGVGHDGEQGPRRLRIAMRRAPARDGVLWVTPRRIDADTGPDGLPTHRLARELARDRDVILLAAGTCDLAADAPWSAAYAIDVDAVPIGDRGRNTRADAAAALRVEFQRLVAIHRPAVVVVEHLEAAGLVDCVLPYRPRFVLRLPVLPSMPARRRDARRMQRDLAAVSRHDGVIVATTEDGKRLGDPRARAIGDDADPAPWRAVVDALAAEAIAARHPAVVATRSAPPRVSARDDGAVPLLGRRLQVT